MMYLADFLQSIEDLPVSLRDMLVTIRELDLEVQNALDKKIEESEKFFRKAERMRQSKREFKFQSLMTDLKKILEDADEKINVAEKLGNILKNSLAQLDREIANFKIDLETRYPGSTSWIEEKVAKSEVPAPKASDKTVTKKQNSSKKNKKKSSSSSATVWSIEEVSTKEPTPIPPRVQEKENVADNAAEIPPNVEASAAVPSVEMMIYDPTLYCICNQVAYGDMVACDNPSCSHEWFHYACVDLTTAPEGTWYCPRCNVSLKKD